MELDKVSNVSTVALRLLFDCVVPVAEPDVDEPAIVLVSPVSTSLSLGNTLPEAV